MADQQSLFPETGQTEEGLNDAANKPLARVELPVYGMSCGKCVARVTAALQSVAGVREVNVLLEQSVAVITFDAQQADKDLFEQAIIAAGYSCQPPVAAEVEPEPSPSPVAAANPAEVPLSELASAADDSERFRFDVRGMTCATCAATITKRLQGTTGILAVSVNFADESTTVEFDPELTSR